MKIVQPNQITTLLLNKAYLPDGFLTARATMHHFITNKIIGIDSLGNQFKMGEKQISFFEDQPCMRSSSQIWPLPTIAIHSHFFVKKRKKTQQGMLSLKQIYNLYQKTCQYCLRKIPFSEATRDHHFPKSKGGTNDDINLVLSCKKCNAKKDSIFPYYNKNGEQVKPKIFDTAIPKAPIDSEFRIEWETFLLKK
jgi:5-methylcytosine-specific restriction endonuclease McrA